MKYDAAALAAPNIIMGFPSMSCAPIRRVVEVKKALAEVVSTTETSPLVKLFPKLFPRKGGYLPRSAQIAFF
jgi:hypothetical protein